MPKASKLLVTCLLVSLVVFIPASVLADDYQPTNCPNLNPLPAKEALAPEAMETETDNKDAICEQMDIVKIKAIIAYPAELKVVNKDTGSTLKPNITTKNAAVPQAPRETPPLSTQPQEETHDFADAYAAKVIRLVNIERANAGLGQLSADAKLNQAAAIRAIEIQSNFSHTRPDGRICFSALSEVGASYSTTGENIAIGQTSPQMVVEAWMASPGHQENIMSPAYSKIGVAALANNGNNYGGYAWTQFFTN